MFEEKVPMSNVKKKYAVRHFKKKKHIIENSTYRTELA
jgi:hypothetical protein